MRACVRACVRACLRACVRSKTYENSTGLRMNVAAVPSLMIQEFRCNVISGTVLDVS